MSVRFNAQMKPCSSGSSTSRGVAARPARRTTTVCSAAWGPSSSEGSIQASGIKAQIMAAAIAALTVCSPAPVLAEEALAPVEVTAATATKAVPETIYFGNGCFWGRQKQFVDTEKALGRAAEQITAVVGYAGGAKAGPDGKVCYYYSDPRTVYEKLGHAEVVKVDIPTTLEPSEAKQEFRRFADTYFKQFRKTPFGMQREDPQDAGPGYRNVVGLPGGVSSPLFKILQDANVNGMSLREGQGNEYRGWNKPSEDDLLNVVWVVDSNKLPFYQAEQYHQFHNGIGAAFPKEYTRDLKDTLANLGRIGPTGCPELPF